MLERAEDGGWGASNTNAYALVALNFEPYICSGGVESRFLGDLNTYRQIQKASQQVSFLGISDQSYDDVYAIYTGALGAVFGVFAIAACAVAVAAIWGFARLALQQLGRNSEGAGCRRGGGPS